MESVRQNAQGLANHTGMPVHLGIPGNGYSVVCPK